MRKSLAEIFAAQIQEGGNHLDTDCDQHADDEHDHDKSNQSIETIEHGVPFSFGVWLVPAGQEKIKVL